MESYREVWLNCVFRTESRNFFNVLWFVAEVRIKDTNLEGKWEIIKNFTKFVSESNRY